MIGLGCMRLSTATDRDDARARAVIAAARACGVTVFDTADAYALGEDDVGHNERLLAGVTGEIVTKGGLVRPAGAWVPDGRAKHLEAAARASAARLGRAPDVYLLHAIDPEVPLATSLRALVRLRDAGVVRAIGVSNVHLAQLEEALAIAGTLAAVEVELSPAKLDAMRDGVVATCVAHGIRVLAHRPLSGPAGARRLARDATLRAIADRLCDALGIPAAPRAGASAAPEPERSERQPAESRTSEPRPAESRPSESRPSESGTSHPRPDEASLRVTACEVALAWLATLAPGVVPLPGATTVAHVSSIARASRLALDDAMRDELAEHFRLRRRARGPRNGGEVVVIAGMPGSGKSTLARELVAHGYARLNRDERGGTLRGIAEALDQLLRTQPGARVVLDNTYPTRAMRAEVIEIARAHGARVECRLIATSLEDCQRNAAARMLAQHGRLLDPDEIRADPAAIGPNALFRFRRGYEPPRADEGWDALVELPFARAAQPPGRRGAIVDLDRRVWVGRPRTPAAVALVDGARDALAGLVARTTAEADRGSAPIGATTWLPGATRDDVSALTARLAELLGFPIPVAACTHLAGPPRCWCRKPLPGLGLVLARTLDLALTRSIHVGASAADQGFADRLGLRAVPDFAAAFAALAASP